MMSYGDPSWRDWILDEDTAEPIVQHAVEAGITFFDTADVYSLGRSEEVTDSDLDIIKTVREIAQKRSVAPAQVALAWLLRNPAVTAPIIGATNVSHLDDAVAAVHLTLDDDEVKALEQPYRPRPVRGINTPGTRGR